MSLLQINNLSYQVNQERILDDISLEITQGQHTSISGPSGSGKSTLLKMMALLLEPSSGNILYKGDDIKLLESVEYRKEVSYSYQSPQLFGKTVQDNLAFPAVIRGLEFNIQRATDLLEDLSLDYIPMTKSVNDLSGGEKQRVALIRNLMYPPQILLLDEVSAGLDDNNASHLWQWLLENADKVGVTLVWISHNEKEQQLAQQQIYIKQGQIVERKDINGTISY